MPYATIPQADADRIFVEAAKQRIRRVNGLDGHVQVSYGGYFYTVLVPYIHRAYITGREGWGGRENMHVNATYEQDRALRAATRTQETPS